MVVEFKTPPTGKEMQTLNGTLWMSPQRDIIYIFSDYIRKALTLYERYEDPKVKAFVEKYGTVTADSLMASTAESIGKFITLTGKKETSDVNQIFKESGLEDQNEDAVAVLQHLIFLVFISGYFNGVLESTSSTLQTFIFGGPELIVQWANEMCKGSQNE